MGSPCARRKGIPNTVPGAGVPEPVLTSQGSSLAEIVRGADGELALCVDALDERALQYGIERILTDVEWRARVVAAGVAHARLFTWTRCVDATVAVYREALAST